jgi:ribose-phosphate pyrophosphokinase
MTDPILVFSGSGSRRLTAGICDYLGVIPGQNETITFSEGNTFVRILENVRGRRVYLIQSTIFPTNDHFMELLFWLDAFRRASARSITAVIPYFSYAKGDKKDEPRVSIRARVCADAIEMAGATRVVTLDLHSPQIQGFFQVPVDNLYAMPVLCDRIRAMGLENLVVVAPDAHRDSDGRFAIIPFWRSSVAQWQSMRLLTAGLLVRVQPEESKRRRTNCLVAFFIV